MKEKERYELFGEHCIKDNDTNARCQLLDAYKACVILNEQDKRIKELEEDLEVERQNTDIAFSLQARYRKENSELIKALSHLNQLQKQLAIEELNNLKKYCHEWYSWSDVAKRLDEVVDDRIKELSGGLNE